MLSPRQVAFGRCTTVGLGPCRDHLPLLIITLRDTLRQLVAVDHPLGSTHPSQGSDTAPPGIPNVAPPPTNVHAFAVPLAPPMYDPALETAPPDLLAGESWHGASGSGAGQAQAHAQVFSGAPQFLDDPMSVGYTPADLGSFAGFDADIYGFGFSGSEDFNMELDTQTIALWSQAPTSFE